MHLHSGDLSICSADTLIWFEVSPSHPAADEQCESSYLSLAAMSQAQTVDTSIHTSVHLIFAFFADLIKVIGD